jgi:phage baseplate assembly protein W
VAKAFSIEDGNIQTQSLVTARNKLYKDIDLTFANKPSTGSNPSRTDIYKKEDAAAVKQAVKNLLMTNFGEKPFQPFFGADLQSLLFDLADETINDSIDIAIRTAVKLYEPRASIRKIGVRALPDNNSVSVYVEFLIINTEEVVTLDTTISRLR